MFGRNSGFWRPACIVLAVISVGLSYGVYKLSKISSGFYARELSARLSPLNLDRVKPLPTGTKGARRIVFLGDSRAQQWTPPKVSGQFFNLGVDGQTTAQVLGRAMVELDEVNPDVVVIQAGINDLKAIAVLPERKAEIIANTKSNLDKIFQMSQKSAKKIIVTTIFPRGQLGFDDRMRWNDRVELAIADVNAYLRKTYPDCFDSARLLGEDTVTTGLSVDLLHLNLTGYEVLNVQLAIRLKD